jgi:arginyl-tRNA synthetase
VHYLKEVSSQYHSFYENFSVLSDDSSIQESRLAVTKATQIVINRGLLILGVEPLKEM